MAVFSGTAGEVNNISNFALEEMKEWSIDIDMQVVDVSSMGDTWNEAIPSIRGFTGSFSGNDGDDTTAENFKTRLENTGQITFRLDLDANNYFEGTAFLTGISNTVSYDGNAQISWNFAGNDLITFVSS